MKFNLTIHCSNCGSGYPFDSHFCEREEYKCPNCGQVYPEKDFALLHSTICGLNELNRRIGSDAQNPNFKINIELPGEMV